MSAAGSGQETTASEVVDEVVEEEVELYEGRLGNDFKSARDDISRSHYTVLPSVMREYSMITNLDTRDSLGKRFVKTKAQLATLLRIVRRAGLPFSVAAEASCIYLQFSERRKTRVRSEKVYWLAILVAAVRRRGLPMTNEIWYDLAASILDLPLDRSKWTDEDLRRVRKLIARADKTLRKLEAFGIYVPSRTADPFEAIPDPQLRYHAIRLYNELKEAGVPGGPSARLLSLYLASFAADRPFTTAKELVDAMRAYGHAGHGTRKGVMEILRRVIIDVTLAPGGAARVILSDSGRDEYVATLRLRCSSCGHEWVEEAYASRSGTFKLGAIGRTIFNAVCPRCGARLGRVVELHVRPHEG